jgi:hypothetical protein
MVDALLRTARRGKCLCCLFCVGGLPLYPVALGCVTAVNNATLCTIQVAFAYHAGSEMSWYNTYTPTDAIPHFADIFWKWGKGTGPTKGYLKNTTPVAFQTLYERIRFLRNSVRNCVERRIHSM